MGQYIVFLDYLEYLTHLLLLRSHIQIMGSFFDYNLYSISFRFHIFSHIFDSCYHQFFFNFSVNILISNSCIILATTAASSHVNSGLSINSTVLHCCLTLPTHICFLAFSVWISLCYTHSASYQPRHSCILLLLLSSVHQVAAPFPLNRPISVNSLKHYLFIILFICYHLQLMYFFFYLLLVLFVFVFIVSIMVNHLFYF